MSHGLGEGGVLEAHSAGGGLMDRIAHHTGLALTLGYALLSAVGVVFEKLLLNRFGADFLVFAEPEDFLMAGLRHPVLLAFVVLPAVMLLAVIWIRERLLRRIPVFERYRQKVESYTWQRRLRPFLYGAAVVWYFAYFTGHYASYEARAIRAGESPAVMLEFLSAAGQQQPAISGSMVAATGHTLFFYERAGGQLHIVPVSSVRQIADTESVPPPTRSK